MIEMKNLVIKCMLLFVNLLIISSSESQTDGNSSTSFAFRTSLNITNNFQATEFHGEDANRYSAPWIVSVQMNMMVGDKKGMHHRCSGVVISKNTIVTSRQCISNLPRHAQLIVVAGIYNLMDLSGTQIRYPNYVRDQSNNEIMNSKEEIDLSVIVLSSQLEFTNSVQIISFCGTSCEFKYNNNFMEPVYQFGWSTNKNAAYFSDLQVQKRNLTNSQELCTRIGENKYKICAPSHACNTGDHGSPLIRLNQHGIPVLIGLWSYDYCSETEAISVYTGVDSYF